MKLKHYYYYYYYYQKHFNEDIHVILYEPFVYKAPLKTAGNLVVLSVDVQSNRPVGFIDTTGLLHFVLILCYLL